MDALYRACLEFIPQEEMTEPDDVEWLMDDVEKGSKVWLILDQIRQEYKKISRIEEERIPSMIALNKRFPKKRSDRMWRWKRKKDLEYNENEEDWSFGN